MATPRANSVADQPASVNKSTEEEIDKSEEAVTEDELGVNDEFFNFKDFRYQGKLDFTDIEQPEDM